MQGSKAIIVFTLFSSTIAAQVNINAGTTVTIESGTTINILTDQQSLNISSTADLENNGQINFGENAFIVEAIGSPIHGIGTEIISKSINGPLLNENPGNLGCEMSTTTSIATITVERGHSAYQNDQSEWGLERWYRVTPSLNGGLDLSLRFYYDLVELNGIDEEDLELNSSMNNGMDWQAFISTVDVSNAHVDAVSIDSLDLFTLFGSMLNSVINESSEVEEIFIYPVPSSGKIIVSNIQDIGQLEEVIVVDQLGRSQGLNNWLSHGQDAISLNAAFLSDAVYDILLIGQDGIARSKMVITK